MTNLYAKIFMAIVFPFIAGLFIVVVDWVYDKILTLRERKNR